MNNGTYYEASNGWQFRVSEEGNMEYRFQGEEKWMHIGRQFGMGFIDWAQSGVWTEEN